MTPDDSHALNTPPTPGNPDLDGLDRAAALRAMVRRVPPAGCGVVEGSTPVMAFGDFEAARVATLGINPSQAEFLKIQKGQGKVLLSGAERRLATLPSLEAPALQTLTDQQADEVLEDCRGYFHRNPLTIWFNQLNHSLAGLDANYYDGSTCHLDISMWAKDPKWNDLSTATKTTLLHDGEDTLRWLLTHGDFDTVVVNGKAVWDQLEQTGLVSATVAGTMRYSSKGLTTTIKKALVGETKIVGWTVNVQSSFGVRTVNKEALGTRVATELRKW